MKRAATLLVSLAVLALARAPAASADELGRLFLTPEQRSALDSRRKARLPDAPRTVVIESATTRIDGLVRSTDGRATVWVNGAAVGDGAQPEGLRVMPRRGDPARVTVEIGEGERRVELKIGQSMDRATGEVSDPLHGGKAAPSVQPQRSR